MSDIYRFLLLAVICAVIGVLVRERSGVMAAVLSLAACSVILLSAVRFFQPALELADSATVLDIYPAREEPIEGVTSEMITSRLHVPGGYAESTDQAVARVAGSAAAGDIILTVGAGDVTALGSELVRRLDAGAESGHTSGTAVHGG